MNKNYTHITFVLDRSGSMSSCWTETMGGLKGFIQDQKKEKNKCTFSFYNFDDKVEKTLNFADIQLVSENVEDFGIAPRGCTALYDAIGDAITETGKQLAEIPEKERAGRVIFVIQTDGAENASRKFTGDKIKELIELQTNQYSWDFLFIGADKNSVLEANRSLGINISNTAFYDTNNTGHTFDLMSAKVNKTRSADYGSYKSMVAFTAEEKEEMAK